MSRTEKEEEERRRLAERQHDLNFDFFKLANEIEARHADAAIKAMLLINGGASIAILAFIGGLAAQGRVELKSLISFTTPLMWFGAGVACATLAAGFAYFSALGSAGQTWNVRKTYDPPYFEATRHSRRLYRLAQFFLWSSFVAGAASLIAFVCGLVMVRIAVLQFG